MKVDKGFSIKEYLLQHAEDEINKVAVFLKFTDEELAEYSKLLTHFKQTNESKTATNKEKGESLEKIVRYTLEKTGIFEVFPNISTSSNEIDILARLNSKGIYFKQQGLLSFENTFLSECKNYKKKVSATWIGKFYTLMKYTENNLGVLFSYHGLSGKNWNDATGLTKKIKLMEKDTYIIDFNYNDFELLSKGENFITLITNKMFNLKNDTSIISFFETHPNQEKVKQMIETLTH